MRTGAEIFVERAGARQDRERIGVWKRRVEDALRGLDLVRVVETATLRERLESQIAKSGLGLRRVSRAKPGSNRWKAAADIRENNEREPTTAAHK